MHLSHLSIRNVRCLEAVDIAPHPGINLIVGRNASGKSSVLEAIHFMARTQSFRSTAPDRLIRHGSQGLSVFGRKAENGSELPIGVSRSRQENHIKIGQKDATVLQLVEALPVQVIDPKLHQLLEEGPDQRRRFLDWGVFHVEQGFYPAWLRYQRALRQRNHALRQGKSGRQVSAWDGELVSQATHIDALRHGYLEELKIGLGPIINGLFDAQAVDVEYSPGWVRDYSLQEALQRGLTRDMEQGYTQCGPHRADLRIRLSGRQARAQASRGEQKLLSASLLLAQAKLLHSRRQRLPLLLIDDLAAELDAGSRQALFGQITAVGAQSFLSFLEPGLIPENPHPQRMFHVEHGRVRPV